MSDIVEDVCSLAGDCSIDASKLGGVVAGYGFEGPVSARDVLEPLRTAYAFDAVERDGEIVFALRDETQISLTDEDLVLADQGDPIAWGVSRLETAPSALRLSFIDTEADFQPGVVTADGDPGGVVADVSLAIGMDHDLAARRAAEVVADATAATQSAGFEASPAMLALEPGDLAALDGAALRISELSEGAQRSGRSVGWAGVSAPVLTLASPSAPIVAPLDVQPDVWLIDPPALPGEEDDDWPLAFAYADPWVSAVALYAGADAASLTKRGEVLAPATRGVLAGALPPAPTGRWVAQSVDVTVQGSLASVADSSVLNGANAALVSTSAGWELLQYQSAELVSAGVYRLSRLLRGQQGSDPAAEVGASAGARIAFLTGDEVRMSLSSVEQELSLVWRASAGDVLSDDAWSASFESTPVNFRPWRPAHLAAEQDGADWRLGWIRRARIGGDAWSTGEPPLSTTESYAVEVLDASDTIVRSWTSTTTTAVYAAVDAQADFPSGGAAIIRVAQIGSDGEPGDFASLSLQV